MGKIKNTRVLASDPETTSAPRFNFRQYRVGDVYHNDGNDIDFVTDNKSLYVCLVESVQASKENIAEQEGLLKLVSQGEQGVPGANGSNGTPGVTPRIDAHFDGKQMIVTVNGAIKAVSPDLGGPSWKPVVEGTTLSWELTTDRYSPAPIDLTTLRPISEHPILLRTNSDNTKYDWETSGPANYIQWKYEGDEYWNNLISISELMNLALAGVSFWYNEDTQEWHFGHKEVIRASYTADKNGRKIISDVELGDILFDAGAVPMPNYEFDIEEIQEGLEQIQTELENYATKDWVEGKGYLTGVDLDDYAKKSEIPGLTDAYTKAESDAKYQPKGSYLTAIKTLGGQSLEGTGSLPLATINGNSLFSNTNYTIPSTDTFATKAELSDYVKSVNNVRPDSTGNVTISVGNLSFDLVTRTVGGKRHLIKISNGVESDLGEFTNGGETGDSSFDVKIENNYLFKSTDNGTTWTRVGQVNSETGGCAKCWSEDEITTLFANNTIADLRIVDSVLQKKVNGQWSNVGPVGGDTGPGCDKCWTEQEIRALFDTNFLTKSVADTFYMAKSGVTVNTNLTSGIEIATITINGVATKLYAPNGTSGSNVRVEQLVSTGEHIANITVDGNTTALYAPGSSTPGDGFYYRTFMIYQRTNSGTNVPTTSDIQSATWNLSNDTLTLVSNTWTNSPENAQGENKYLWMTSATFKSSTQSRVGSWSTPICLTGETGDGEDGSGIEFIFRLCSKTEYSRVINAGAPEARYKDNRDDDIPASDSLAIHQWQDHPEGISPEYPYELAAIRTSTDGVWQLDPDYSEPFVWSRWGEDGLDGDGVEYVYLRVEEDYVTTDASGSIRLIPNIIRPNNNWEYDSPVAPWTDNPTGVTAEEPYEFASVRKTQLVNDEKVWGNWSEPALWAKYSIGSPGPIGPAGDQYEYVYGRTNSVLPTTAYTTLISSDDVTEITQDSSEYQTDRYLPKFTFNFADSTTLSVRCTPTPQGVSSTNSYEFVAIRRKHNDVWGPFSDPSLHNNFVEAGLTDEQLEEIKIAAAQATQENLSAAIVRLDAAENEINQAKNKLNNLDSVTDGLTTTTNKLTGRVQKIEGWTVYDEDDIKSFAGTVVDAKTASILSQAASDTDGKITTVNLALDAINGTIDQHTNRLNTTEGTLTTVGQRLDIAETSITTFADWKNNTTQTLSTVGTNINAINSTLSSHATRLNAAENSVNNVQSDLNALEGSLTNTVASSHYLMNDNNEFVDVDGNVIGEYIQDCETGNYYILIRDWRSQSNFNVIIKTYKDSQTGEYVPIYRAVSITGDCISHLGIWYDENVDPLTVSDDGLTVTINGEDKPILTGLNAMVLTTEALSQIKQTAGEVDILAIDGDKAAQILVKANEASSSIVLDADKINLHGDVSAQNAAINSVWINDAKITNGTITNATINDCTIVSSLQSSNYNATNKTGFLLDAQGGDFALYAANGTKFDNINGIEFGQNQTISWSNVTDTPTIITRDSLSTNKIKANEIEAGAITGNHIAAHTITADNLAAGAITADRIETNDTGSGRITINANDDNAIKGYSRNASVPGLLISGANLQTLSTPINVSYNTQTTGFNNSGGTYPLIGSYYNTISTLQTAVRNNNVSLIDTTIDTIGDSYDFASATVQGHIDWQLKKSNGSNWTSSDTVPGYYCGLHLIKCHSDNGIIHVDDDLGTLGNIRLNVYENPADRPTNGRVTINMTLSKSITVTSYSQFLAIAPLGTNSLSDSDHPGAYFTFTFDGTINATYSSGISVDQGVTLAPNGIRAYFGNNDYFEFIKLSNGTVSSTMVVDGITRFSY